jgi:hypothetical protein
LPTICGCETTYSGTVQNGAMGWDSRRLDKIPAHPSVDTRLGDRPIVLRAL